MIILGLLYILADAILFSIVLDRNMFVYSGFLFVLALAIGHIISGVILIRRQRV